MLPILQEIILERVEKLFQHKLLFTKDETCMFLDEVLSMFLKLKKK